MVDAIIRLFEDTASSFDTNGIGYLSDAVSCTVTEIRNGEFELEMKYPIKGIRYSELLFRRIIVAKSNPYSDPQAFRIYRISKPIRGIVTVNAEHISYDLSGIPVRPFEASSAYTALLGMKTNAEISCPFNFWTDKTVDGNFKIKTPSNIRNCLGGVEGSILDTFGTGEYEFDNYDVKLYLHRGADRGVTLRYGKNITDLEQEENNSNVYTGVYPYWYSEEDGLVESNPKIINVSGNYNYRRIYILDLSYDWLDKPSPDDLKAAAESYIKTNDIGVPKVSLDVSFVNLSDSEEYSSFRNLETVHLCDTVHVIFEELGVNASSKCIKTVYNCLTNKYDKISLGDSRTSLADTISSNKVTVTEKIDDQKTYMERAVLNATSMITGNLGGYVVLHSSTGSKKPDEILIMDTEDINTAKHVWRWNKSGLGFSKNGYPGPYETAITANGQIVANFITVGELSASRISGGELNLTANNLIIKSDNFELDQYGNAKLNSLEAIELKGPAIDQFNEEIYNSDTMKRMREIVDLFNDRMISVEQLLSNEKILFNTLDSKDSFWYGSGVGVKKLDTTGIVTNYVNIDCTGYRYVTVRCNGEITTEATGSTTGITIHMVITFSNDPQTNNPDTPVITLCNKYGGFVEGQDGPAYHQWYDAKIDISALTGIHELHVFCFGAFQNGGICYCSKIALTNT